MRRVHGAALAAPSAQMRPPWRSIIRCTVASPIPVPGNSDSVCRRWNGLNSLLAEVIRSGVMIGHRADSTTRSPQH